MARLTDIPGVNAEAEGLLHAAGVRSAEDLARVEEEDLRQRLAGLGVAAPGDWAAVSGWVAEARRMAAQSAPPAPTGTARAKKVRLQRVNLDDVPEAIVGAPAPPKSEAPAPGSGPAKNVAPMRTRTQKTRDEFSARKLAAEPPRPAAPLPAPPEPQPLPETDPANLNRREVAKEAFRDFSAYEAGEGGIAPLPKKLSADEEELEEMARRVPMKPGQKLPRSFKRGVPHPRPFFLLFSAVIVIIGRLLLLAMVIGVPVALYPAVTKGDHSWLWAMLWVVGGWLFFGVLYALFPLRARCRVCTNHIFFSKNCIKNSKAHRLPIIGMPSSLALHMLLFSWFRCMYCGTAIRIKFGADPERGR